jgi:hypothetical protein
MTTPFARRDRVPLFLRPLTALTEEEEDMEVAEIVRLVEAVMDEMSAQQPSSQKPDRGR